MKICVAQNRPVTGDIPANIDNHKVIIELAASHGTDTIFFPELSLTGYEPRLAKELATDANDYRFDELQKISDTNQIVVGVGLPAKNGTGVCIGTLIFHPRRERQIYTKKYLHPDEEEFFDHGQNFTGLLAGHNKIALAICYEISVSEHARAAFDSGAEIYMASVAKFINGIGKAIKRMSDIAAGYSMITCMSNCIGEADGYACAGKTSIWDRHGRLAGQLDDENEGILIFDTGTEELIREII